MRLIHDGDGNHESECGRICVYRSYEEGGFLLGWAVYVEGENGIAHLDETFAGAKAWARAEAKNRGWDHKLRWDFKAPGHHEAILPDGAVLVAEHDPVKGSLCWRCYRLRGDDRRWIASACSWRNLRDGVRDLGENAHK